LLITLDELVYNVFLIGGIMSVMAQLYCLAMSVENLANALPGCFVMESDESEMIAGFITKVDYEKVEFEICLFEPTRLEIEGVRVIRQAMSQRDVFEQLEGALAANPEMRPKWDELLAVKE